MTETKLRARIGELTDYLNTEIQARLGDRIETVMYLGSYALGRVSLARPDINYVLIWKERATADDYLTLGEILSKAIHKFLDYFVVRPEFRPFKFGYPAERGKQDVFVNISCLNMADQANNFFLPEYVLDGFKHSRKMVFGSDIFAEMEFQVTKQSILNSAMQKLASHKIQLDRVPLVYDIETDIDLIFNESLDHGKNLAYFGVEVVMSDEQIRAKEYLPIIGDKRELLEFYRQHFPKPTISALETLLDSRDNFTRWKTDRKRTFDVYKAAFLLHGVLVGMVMKQLSH